MKKYFILFIAFLFVSQLSAQGRGGNRNPADRAKAQTQLMADSLQLSAAQVDKIAAVNLEFAEKTTALRKEMRNSEEQVDRETMRSKMQALRQDQKAALNKYLTQAQIEKWETMQESIQQNRSSRRGKGKGKKRDKSS